MPAEKVKQWLQVVLRVATWGPDITATSLQSMKQEVSLGKDKRFFLEASMP